jgi:hypothetical protein
MKVGEVILQAMGREIEWIEAADLLGVAPRTIGRMRAAYQEQGSPAGGATSAGAGHPNGEPRLSWGRRSFSCG